MKNQIFTREVLEEKIDVEVKRIIDDVVNEYHQFKENMLNSTTKDVFDKAFQINVYNDYDIYFENDGFVDMISYYIENKSDAILINLYNSLLGMENNILYTLYEFLFNYDSMSTTTWENINEIIKDCYFIGVN